MHDPPPKCHPLSLRSLDLVALHPRARDQAKAGPNVANGAKPESHLDSGGHAVRVMSRTRIWPRIWTASRWQTAAAPGGSARAGTGSGQPTSAADRRGPGRAAKGGAKPAHTGTAQNKAGMFFRINGDTLATPIRRPLRWGLAGRGRSRGAGHAPLLGEQRPA